MCTTQFLSTKNVRKNPARRFSGAICAVLAVAAAVSAVILAAGCEGNNPAKPVGNGEPSPITLANLEGFMVLVEGGSFTIGCREKYEEVFVGPDTIATCLSNKLTTVGDFYICKLQVTQGLWKEVMGDTANLSEYKGDNLPVTNVGGREIGRSSTDQNTFFEYLSKFEVIQSGKYDYRILTEVEWEYAARGGKDWEANGDPLYSGSDDINLVARYGGHTNKSVTGPRPVGEKKPTSNELDIYDMSGNVWEIVQIDGAYMAERGGGWYGTEGNCRSTKRNYLGSRNSILGLSDRGFRIAATPKKSE